MIIRKVLIHNFRSFRETCEVDIEDTLTVIVGKNESGKTNLLQALKSFSPEYEYIPADLCHFSPVREEVEHGDVDEGTIPMVTLTLDLDDEEKSHLEFNLVFPGMDITITKLFDNSYCIGHPKDDASTTFSEHHISTKSRYVWVKASEDIFDSSVVINKINSILHLLTEKLDQNLKRFPEIQDEPPWYRQIYPISHPYTLSVLPRVVHKIYEKLRFPKSNFPDLGWEDSPWDRFLDDHDVKLDIYDATEKINFLRDYLENLGFGFGLDITLESFFSEIFDLLPAFVYMSDPPDLANFDHVPLTDFIDSEEQFRALDNIIRIADFDVVHFPEMTPTMQETHRKVVNERLNQAIREAMDTIGEEWHLKIDVQDGIIKVLVEEGPGIWVLPSQKSRGFQWLLSFIIEMAAMEWRKKILLLDDPGAHLHPAWQRRLLQLLEKIEKHIQIVLCTHSPFFISENQLQRIRIALRTEHGDTVVTSKFYESDFDALEPVRTALGVSLSDFLFSGRCTLLVEGISDRFILEAMSNMCQREGLSHLNLSEVFILPANGVQKVPYYAALLLHGKMEIFVVIDDDEGGRSAKRTMTKGWLIPEKKIVTLDQVTGKQESKDVEIEDLFGDEFYLKAVNKAYQKAFQGSYNPIRLESLEKHLPQKERYSKFFSKQELGKFDHMLVAKEIHKSIDAPDAKDEISLNNFSKLFKLLNERIAEGSLTSEM